jgi:hypothetical protein
MTEAQAQELRESERLLVEAQNAKVRAKSQLQEAALTFAYADARLTQATSRSQKARAAAKRGD